MDGQITKKPLIFQRLSVSYRHTPQAMRQQGERNERTPSVEIARNIAQALEVSLDYLVGNTDLLLDASIIRKIEEIQKLPSQDREHLFYLMDNILQNVKAKKAFAS